MMMTKDEDVDRRERKGKLSSKVLTRKVGVICHVDKAKAQTGKFSFSHLAAA